ncbi:MAG: BspA family leucine-rich repeat surface protein [Firmicutes bacterium]|nr:BspA family leucine-rich repeat surface protein [Bacillota bacterium]
MGLFSKTSGKGWSFDKKSGRLTINGDLGNVYKPFEKIADKVTSVAALKGSRIINGKDLFMDMDKLVSADLAELDVSVCEDMSYMFLRCASLASLDLNTWNVSQVKTMADMFHSCRSLSSLDLTNWDISNVENMSGMFDGCSNLVSIKTGPAWIPKKLTDTICMFGSCLKLRQLDINSWSPARLEYCHMMFKFCESLTELDLSSMNVTNVKSFYEMFIGCSSLRVLNLGGWSTENVNDMTQLFYKCRKLETLNLTGWHISEGTKIKDMFEYVPKNVKILYNDNTVFCHIPEEPLTKKEIQDIYEGMDDKTAFGLAEELNKIVEDVRYNTCDSKTIDMYFDIFKSSGLAWTKGIEELSSYDDKVLFLANYRGYLRYMIQKTDKDKKNKSQSAPESPKTSGTASEQEPLKPEDIKDLFGGLDPETAELMAHDINFVADYAKNNENIDSDTLAFLFKKLPLGGYVKLDKFNGLSYKEKVDFLAKSPEFFKALNKMAGKK